MHIIFNIIILLAFINRKTLGVLIYLFFYDILLFVN